MTGILVALFYVVIALLGGMAGFLFVQAMGRD